MIHFIKLLLVFLLVLPVNGFTQAHLSTHSKLFLSHIEKHKNKLEELPDELVREYHLKKINDSYIASAVIFVENGFNPGSLLSLGVDINSRIGNMWTIRFPVHLATEILNINGISHFDTGSGVDIFLELEAIDVKADSVHQGLTLPRKYTGKGVIVGVIDWGFDYTHPVFYDTNLTNLRIARAWDQNKTTGNHPAGYSYGAEYTSQFELLAAQHDTEYVFGINNSHGTHVAGIAAGSGGGTIYKGIAPDAELVMVSLLRTSASMIDAFTYIADYAAAVNKPFVINMSFGAHLGPHDGTLPENLAIDAISGPGRIFVGSAGNNGGNNFQIEQDFSNTDDTLKTIIEFGRENTFPGIYGQAIPVWGSPNSSFKAGLVVYGGGELLVTTEFYNTNDERMVDTFLVIGNDTIYYSMVAVKSNFTNNRPSILFQIRNQSQYSLGMHVTGASGMLHAWNVIRMNNRFTNWGRQFLNSIPVAGNLDGYKSGNPAYAVGEPGGVGKEVITVGAYRAERYFNNRYYFGTLAPFSSMGPTIDGRVKPDISGPGVNVVSSVSSFINSTTVVASVQHNGRTYPFDSYSGTSMSGPVVAGIVALMLEADPLMDARQAKKIIRETARADEHTGIIPEGGSNVWGWGKVNALAAVAEAVPDTSEIDTTPVDKVFKIYPNPSNGNFKITFGENNEGPVEFTLHELSGRQVESFSLYNLNRHEVVPLNLQHLYPGFYLMSIKGINTVEVVKVKIF